MTPKLFKAENNERAEEIKRSMPVSVNFNFETLAAGMAMVERKILIPLIGKSLFDEMVEYYNSINPNDPLKNEGLSLLQYAEVYIAMAREYPLIAVQIDDRGASSKFTKDDRLFKYQEDALIETLRDNGYNMLDDVLAFFETNVATFPAFEESNNYSGNVDSVIRNISEVQENLNISNSHLVYLQLRYFFTIAENHNLQHVIGKEMLTLLKNRDERVANMIEYAQQYTVFQAMTIGVGELGKKPTERGLFLERFYSETSEQVAADSTQLQQSVDFYKGLADNALANLLHEVTANLQQFPEYSRYTTNTTATDTVFRRNNNGKKTFVI